MKPYQQNCTTPEIKEATIRHYVDQILNYPMLAESVILRRFLEFVVEETLAGRLNQLKEYTIAVNVLNKPKDFRTQNNGIVRIHAGRLRRVLEHYYMNGPGINDEVKVVIPKGTYVPRFIAGDQAIEAYGNSGSELSHGQVVPMPLNRPTIAVMPVSCAHTKKAFDGLADGIGIQLCDALLHEEGVNVIAYDLLKTGNHPNENLENLAMAYKFNYAVLSTVQVEGGDVKVNVRLINTQTKLLQWSKMYKRKVRDLNILELQDDLVNTIHDQLHQSIGHMNSGKLMKGLVSAG
ncbi:hypothetical protein KJS94_07830 [Flavihumibacter rivuli]|uniref:hypothetical protein n=1 Tax=Flavihumibacter rivuli TaxID=2838156 RepID=UPI001BDEB562|nr:hypothetical protein [Flavihumibacter rivuli]ULQ58108.1 hypothetical protein KJS94_07830 [Flavihumibacter rivuli]